MRTKDMDQMKFCIIIPMYNEVGNVNFAVTKVNEVLRENGFNADIIIVNDGSIDGTAEEITEQTKKHDNVLVVTHQKNQGFGAALKTGMQKAIEQDYEFAIFMDADLTMDPKYIISFNNKMKEGYDFVIGSRFISGGGMHGVPLKRAAISWIGGGILRVSFRLGLKDYTQGFRAIKIETMKKMKLKETGFPILVEEIFQAMRYTRKFAEIPFVLTTRKIGTSKFNYKFSVFLKYLLYALRGFLCTTRAK